MNGLSTELCPAAGGGFLRPTRQEDVFGGVLVQGGYSLEHFSEALFERFEIQRPERLAQAIDKRLAEFLAGRIMARLAQEALGRAPCPIPIGDDRAPVWPKGLNGSISHARGWCACLALPAECGLPGVDIERVAEGQALQSILRMTVNKTEAALIQSAPLPGQVATLCFSAKETLFKALFPVVKRHFGFNCAVLRALPQGGVLTLYLTEDLHHTLPAGRGFDIHYRTDDAHVLTWMVHRP